MRQKAAVDYIARSLRESGGNVDFQTFRVDNREYVNVRSVIPGREEGRIIIGAHYDTCGDTPGADDNASRVAGQLETARLLKGIQPQYTIELVAYANEEPPYFKTIHMGSAHHARLMAESKTTVHAMLCLEMIGYYSDREKARIIPAAPFPGFTRTRATSSPFSATGAAFRWPGRCSNLSKATCRPCA